MYDMLMGNPPFQSKNDANLHKQILTKRLKMPSYLSKEAHSILKGLMERNTKKRLGTGKNGAQDVKRHPFFKGMKWPNLKNKRIAPPFKPDIKRGMMDTGNFDPELTKQHPVDSPVNSPLLSTSKDALFSGFSYIRSPEMFCPLKVKF